MGKMQLQPALLWVCLTAFCWGTYGPTLHDASMNFGGSRIAPFMLVGLAYFVFAVLGSLFFLKTGMVKDCGSFTQQGAVKGLIAGALGALGALALLFALKFNPNPLVVMPLVFGGLQFFNCAFTALAMRRWPRPMALLGIFLLAAGTVLVLGFRPAPPGQNTVSTTDIALSLMFIFIGNVLGGRYGVQVHQATTALGGSEMRTMTMIGLAYLICAILIPAPLLASGVDSAKFSGLGAGYGFLAGMLGALGTFAVIFGNKYVIGGPEITMPLIFAGAPLINSCYSILKAGTPLSSISPIFAIGIGIVIVGAHVVLTNKPAPPT